MKMTKTRYSISAASRLTGKSRNTIAKHLKEGKLSCTSDGSGAKLIDASELIRVYGDACQFDREDAPKTDNPSKSRAGAAEQGSHPELRSLQQQLEKEVTERERERSHYREQITQLETSLERAQEGHNRATLLLESQAQSGDRGEGAWRDAIERLEGRLQTIQQQTQAETRRELLSQPWWRLLWG